MLRRVLGPFKEFGLWVGALYVVDRLLRSVSPQLGLYVYELMVQPITGKAMLPANLAKNLQFVEIGPGHPDLALMPARDDIKQARFEQGAQCLGVYRKGQLLGYIWFSTDRYLEDEVRFTYELAVPAQSVFDFDLYVLPEHRLGIAFMAIWHGANLYLHRKGVRYTFSRLTRFNLASRRSHARLGWGRVCRTAVLKLGRIELQIVDMRPFVRLVWRAEQRTTLRLWPTVLQTAHADTAAPALARRPADRIDSGTGP